MENEHSELSINSVVRSYLSRYHVPSSHQNQLLSRLFLDLQTNNAALHRSVNVTQDGLVTFVLPIKGTAEELGFVRNQLHSFDIFLAHEGLREIIILCPSEDLPHVASFVQTSSA